MPPTSRSPLFLGQGEEVVEKHAAYVAAYNKQLAAMVDGFKENHEGVCFSLLFFLFSFFSIALQYGSSKVGEILTMVM